MFVWFDPDHELLTLRDLTADEKSVNLDSVDSVSAVGRAERAELSDGCEEVPDRNLTFGFYI